MQWYLLVGAVVGLPLWSEALWYGADRPHLARCIFLDVHRVNRQGW
jgi:hypothetical protein